MYVAQPYMKQNDSSITSQEWGMLDDFSHMLVPFHEAT